MNVSVSATPFAYDALPDSSSIRLLQRHDKTPDGTLSFSLQAHSIGQRETKYHCLSYTWGNPYAHGTPFREQFDAASPKYDAAHKVPILVNGCVLWIQKNLHDALSAIPTSAYADDLNNPTSGGGRTNMHFTAARGRAEDLGLWLSRGGRVDVVDDDGRTPLHLAAANGHLMCVELLSKRGSLREAKDIRGFTPCDLARDAGHDEVVRSLESMRGQPDPAPSSISREVDGPEKLLWADAICINQDDVNEKSVQVSMMDRIYSEASFVVAWMGPHDEYSKNGMQTLRTLACNIEKFGQSSIEPFHGEDTNSYTEAGIPLITPSDWKALGSLFQRQWSRRAWIVQEAVLPDVLVMYIGDSLISWHDLGAVAETLRRSHAKLGRSRSRLFVPKNETAIPVEWNMAELYKWRLHMSSAGVRNKSELAKKYREYFTLEELTTCFWTFLASDPRDKVFAMHGILNIFADKRLMSDYRLSVASVYTAATRRIIWETGNLSVLSWCIYFTKRRENLPSWAPDFSLPGINGIPDIFLADRGLDFCPPESSGTDDRTLRVQGLVIGTITRAGGRRGTGPSQKFLFDTFWLSMASSLDPPEANTTDKPYVLSEVLWRTLCMDLSYGSFYDAKQYGSHAPEEFGQQFKIFMLLMIFAGADEKVLEKMGKAADVTVRDMVVDDTLYNPFDDDMSAVLDDLDKFEAHDGGRTCVPTREEVLVLWDSLKYTLVRNSGAGPVGEPQDFYVPKEVMDGTARIVGNGFVHTGSRIFDKCRGFATAFDTAYGGRQLVVLDNRYLCLAPLSAAVGDEVLILPGLKVPAVVRPVQLGAEEIGAQTVAEAMESLGLQEDPPCRYHFVGSCYVDGLMNGEAAAEGRDTELRRVELI